MVFNQPYVVFININFSKIRIYKKNIKILIKSKIKIFKCVILIICKLYLTLELLNIKFRNFYKSDHLLNKNLYPNLKNVKSIRK